MHPSWASPRPNGSGKTPEDHFWTCVQLAHSLSGLSHVSLFMGLWRKSFWGQLRESTSTTPTAWIDYFLLAPNTLTEMISYGSIYLYKMLLEWMKENTNACNAVVSGCLCHSVEFKLLIGLLCHVMLLEFRLLLCLNRLTAQGCSWSLVASKIIS